MKRIAVLILVAAILVFSSAIGWAADSASSAYKWTGPYIGVNAGWGRGSSDVSTTTVFSPTGYFATTSPGAVKKAGEQDLSSSTFIGGGQVGYNWQSGNIVIGGEMDLDYFHPSADQKNSEVYPCCGPTSLTVKSSAHTDWMFTVRPRIGYAANNWLLYATGGLAVTKLNADFEFSDTFADARESAHISKTKTGWTVGGGVEMGITKNWSIKTEYLYADFGGVTVTSHNLNAFNGPTISFPENTFTHKIDLHTHIVRVGLNYKF